MQQLSILGFRGCTKSVELIFEDKPVVMIFGENGTGKSTIVDAIDFVCNESAGALGSRQSTPIKEFLPALGCKAVDLKVVLKWESQSWTAALDGAKAKVTGPTPRPKARILRRAQILEIVDAQPANRYAAFSRFVSVPKVEQAEGALREAVRTTKSDFETATRSLSEAQGALRRLQTEAGTSGLDMMLWAKAESEVDSHDLSGKTQHIGTLLSLVQAAKSSASALDAAKTTAEQESTTVQSLTINLEAAEQASDEAKNDLLKLLDVASDYLIAHEEQDTCPVCEQSIDRNELIERLAARKQSGIAVMAASAELEAARKQEDRRQTLLQDAQTRFLTASTSLIQGFRTSESSAVTAKKVDWRAFALLEAVISDDQRQAAQLQAQSLLFTCEQCDAALQAEKTKLAAELEALKAIKIQYAAVLKHGKQAKEQESLSGRLQSVLDIVEKQRKAFVDQALSSITARVDTLYTKLHPNENLGDIKLQLDPNRRGSLNVSSRFESRTNIPPQAYYSEAHLDTLGICIFVALAEKDAATGTLLVLDDVLTSADQPHVDRFITVVHEEVKLPVLITTHYRPWRDRYRYAKGPVANVHLIELLAWSQERGIRHTKTKLEAEELKVLLVSEPIDRQSLASKTGVLLEAVLRELCLLYKCKLAFEAEGRHTLGEYLNGIDSKLRKLLKSTTNAAGSQNSTELQPLIEAVDSMSWIRNQVGAHFNISGMDIADAQIVSFAKGTFALLDALVCFKCGEMPRKSSGSSFSCGCKATELHPLTIPGAQAA